MAAKKRGRPPTGNRRREAEVTFNLTLEDAEWLERAALQLGFRNRGQLLTAIMERLCVAQFAPFAFLKVGWQLNQRAQETGSAEGAGLWNPFREVILPLDPAEPPRPPMPMPEEDLAPANKKQLLAEVRKQLQAT